MTDEKRVYDELVLLREKLERIVQDDDAEAAHSDGDDVLVDALTIIAEHASSERVASELQRIVNVFTKASGYWWYS